MTPEPTITERAADTLEALGPVGVGHPPEKPDAKSDSAGGYRRLMRNSGFRRLWWSQFISGVGDWLVIGFLIPLVTTLSGGSSFAVAGILIAKILPALILSSFTGALVDRSDRRKVMIAADLTRAVLALLLFGTNSLAVIYTTVFLMETASLFFVPAKNALIPYLVEEKDLASANGLSYTTTQASMLVGLTTSGAILALFERLVRGTVEAQLPFLSNAVGLFAPALVGPRAGVVLDSLTFLLSAWAIYGIRIQSRVEHAGKMELSLIGKDVIESFQFLGQHKELRGLLVTIGFAILGGGAIIPVGITYVQKNLSPGKLLSEIAPLAKLAATPQFRQLAATPQTFMLAFLALGMVAGALNRSSAGALRTASHLVSGECGCVRAGDVWVCKRENLLGCRDLRSRGRGRNRDGNRRREHVCGAQHRRRDTWPGLYRARIRHPSVAAHVHGCGLAAGRYPRTRHSRERHLRLASRGLLHGYTHHLATCVDDRAHRGGLWLAHVAMERGRRSVYGSGRGALR